MKHYDVYERYITKQLQQNFDFNNFKNIFAKLFKSVKTKIHVETLLKIKITLQITAVAVRKKRNNNNKRINHYNVLTLENAQSKIKTRLQIELFQKKNFEKTQKYQKLQNLM